MVGVVVAVGMTASASVAFSQFLSQCLRAQKYLDTKSDLLELRKSLEGVECSATLTSGGIDPALPAPSLCQSDSTTQKGPYLKLFRNTPFGPKPLTTTPQESDGSFRLGGWKIRASCSQSEGSLIVRVASTSPSQTDPITKEKMDWTWKRGLLFAGTGGKTPLCLSATSGPQTAQAFRMGGTTFPAKPIYVLAGPSDAFVPIDNVYPHAGEKSVDLTSGIGCNGSKGWRLSGCWSRVQMSNSDISPYENGCVAFEMIKAPKASLSITCVR